jgi:hypothetical protein
MLRKIIGTTLLILGGLGIVLLVAAGGPILPHAVGPAVLVVAGTLLLLFKGKAKGLSKKEQHD